MEVGIIPELTMELVEESARALKSYVDTLEEQYLKRSDWRAKNGFPVLCYLGHGRSGKDTAAKVVADCTELKYGGSTSSIICPLIAHSLGISDEQAFAERHQHRVFWFDWCNLYRANKGADVVARYLLGLGDFVVGLRDKEEVEAAHNSRLVTHIAWVDKPDVPIDPTVAYDWPLIQSLGGVRLLNDGTLEQYESVVKSHAWMAGLDIK